MLKHDRKDRITTFKGVNEPERMIVVWYWSYVAYGGKYMLISTRDQ